MTILGAGNIFSIIREIDLSKTKAEAETRFTLLLTGQEDLARALALKLSEDSGKAGVHPWLVVAEPLASSALGHYDLALFVSARLEPGEEDRRRLRHLQEAGVPVLAVVVSDELSDRVGAEVPRPLERARVVLPSSLAPQDLKSRLPPALLQAAGQPLRLSLARQLPLLRRPAVQDLVEETSRANALYTASSGFAKVVPILNIPLNVADIVVLTKNQLVMAYKIALMTGKSGEPRDVLGEIVGVVGGGFFFRQVARELVGLVPVIGIVPNVAVSYAGTKVIGHSVYTWACQGKNLDRGELRQFYQEALEQGRRVARMLVGRLRRREKAALPPPREEEPREEPREEKLN
jgi:uncharacterized protein (DUF697 family)